MDREIYLCTNPVEWGKLDFLLSINYACNKKVIPPEPCIRKKTDGLGCRFFYIVKGELTFWMPDGRIVKASKGDVMYLAQDVEYYSEWNPQMEAEHMIFVFDMIDINGRSVCLRDELDILVADKKGKFYSYFRDLCALYTKESVQTTATMKGVFYQFLSELIDTMLHGDVQLNEEDSLIYPGIEYIREHYLENFKVEKLAELCNVSEPTFRRVFKYYCGESPMRYKNRLKLDHAKKLLETGLYTVAEVAEITNFSDISYFTKSFKALFGRKPSSYTTRE